MLCTSLPPAAQGLLTLASGSTHASDRNSVMSTANKTAAKGSLTMDAVSPCNGSRGGRVHLAQGQAGGSSGDLLSGPQPARIGSG